jgi:hypothetical protein
MAAIATSAAALGRPRTFLASEGQHLIGFGQRAEIDDASAVRERHAGQSAPDVAVRRRVLEQVGEHARQRARRRYARTTARRAA